MPALCVLARGVKTIGRLRLAGPRNGKNSARIGIETRDERAHPITGDCEEVNEKLRTQTATERDTFGIQSLNQFHGIRVTPDLSGREHVTVPMRTDRSELGIE